MQKPLIIDLGTGFLKYGYPDQPKPRIMPAYLKATEDKKGDQYLIQLDPTRGGRFFPFENANLPEAEVVKPLILEVFDRVGLGGHQRVATEVQLLVFSTVDPNHVYQVCDELRGLLGCRKLIAAYQQLLALLFLEKHTGMVVDIGHSITLVTPIYQGYLLREHIIDTATGGLYVSSALRKLLEEKAKDSSQYSDYAKLATDVKAVEYIKRNFCQVNRDPRDPTTPREWNYRRKNLDIPLGSTTWKAPEVLFDPSLLGISDSGIVDAIVNAIEQVDITIRRELSNDIVLIGGGSMILGLRERLELELKRKLSHLPVNVYGLEDALSFAWQCAVNLVKPVTKQ
jgi:actin-related protein